MAGEYINPEVLDQGLDYADTNGTRLEICSSAPATYGAISGVSLGNDTVNTGATADGDTDGRKVTIPAITAGSVTGTGTATHWALTDGSAVLIAVGPLTTSFSVTSGRTFTLDAITITKRDP